MRAAVSTWWTYRSSSVRQRQQRGGGVADDDVERWSAGAESAALVVRHDGQQAQRNVGGARSGPLGQGRTQTTRQLSE